MKKYIYICDRCGEEIKGHVHQILAMVKNDSDDNYTEALDGQREKHYCTKCMTDIIDSLSRPTGDVKTEKPKRHYTKHIDAPKKHRGRPRKSVEPVVGDGIDLSRVGALRKAGWNDNDITDDMRTTVAEIYRAERIKNDR